MNSGYTAAIDLVKKKIRVPFSPNDVKYSLKFPYAITSNLIIRYIHKAYIP